MSSGPRVAVVGSINSDLVVPVPRHPLPGETLLGGDVTWAQGGKGANQAVAVAGYGTPTAFVGRVGDDDRGDALRGGLEAVGVTTDALLVSAGVPSGLALIAVAEDGENTIIVSPGANARLTGEDVRASAEVLTSAAVLLLQLEIGEDAVAAAVETAGGRVVLNPAPARSLPEDVLARVDVLVPNRQELAAILDADVPADADRAAELARRLGIPSVVVTLGAEGALLVAADEVLHVPAPPVRAVDTTGAGDAFCGALAHCLAAGADMPTSVRWAVAAGALSTTRPGARTAPSTDEVERLLGAGR